MERSNTTCISTIDYALRNGRPEGTPAESGRCAPLYRTAFRSTETSSERRLATIRSGLRSAFMRAGYGDVSALCSDDSLIFQGAIARVREHRDGAAALVVPE